MFGLFVPGCARGPATTPVTPSASGNLWKGTSRGSVTSTGVKPDSGSRTMAAGDVQNGPIEIREVRIRRGAPGSQADVHPNALAGTVVRAPALDQEIEMWVTWSASPAPAAPPRLVIDFGDGWVDNISCGSCLLRHAYGRVGRYTVRVLMDDRVGGTTTRTFILEVADTCGRSLATDFDGFVPGTPGSELGIAGLSAPALTSIIPTFSSNTSGLVLIAFVGDGDVDLGFGDDQAAVQFDYAYQSGFPATLSVFDGNGQLIQSTPAVGVFDGFSSDVGHVSVSSSRGIGRVVLGNGSNGVLIDNLQTTAVCRP
jgi:hypothetical protein